MIDVPRISIVVPAYNVAEFISETLDSAIAQTFLQSEIIVVNDGSPDSDELEKVLEKYFDEIVYIKQENAGVASARNCAIDEARGSIVAFLDGDDIWFPEKLSTQIQFLEQNDFDMVYCNARLFGEPLYEAQNFMDNAPSNGEVTTENLLSGECNVLTSAAIVKKELVIKVGSFDEKAVRIEDFDLWIRLCNSGVKIGYQREVLLKYRIRAGSLTGNSVQRSERSIAALQLVRNKNEFSESELAAWQKQLQACETQLALEKGKHNLISGNFEQARSDFATANSIKKSSKLKVLDVMLAISPKLVLAVFKKMRPTEFSYLAPSNDEK